MLATDTIVAISSATGPATRMILRISGADVASVARSLGIDWIGGGVALRRQISFSGLSFPAWVYQFTRPRSYTGEDLAELHIPGNPLLARLLINFIVSLGARQAEPGEFTARAYFRGKLDLTQAEGIAATISAQNDRQLCAARRLMDGELARRMRPILESLAQALALVEAGIDFSDEGIEFLSFDQIQRRIEELELQIATLMADSDRFERLAHEPTIALAGRPNAGKSTLANALAGHERSVVSPHAGTTRDALSVVVKLRRGNVRLLDLAGLEAATSISAGAASDIEAQMQSRAAEEVARADVVLLVREIGDSRPDIDLPRAPDLRLATKADLAAAAPHDGLLPLSAVTGEGLDALREALNSAAFGSDSSGAALALTTRHVQSLTEAQAALRRGRGVIKSAELLAAELRRALDLLGDVLGAVSPDDILGRVFSSFCIGK